MNNRSPALIAVFALLFTFTAAVVIAQEPMGAARMELSGAPGGGVFFTTPANKGDIDFSNYALTGGFNYNMNRLFGVEAEIGGGVIGTRHEFVTTTAGTVTNDDGTVVTTETSTVTRARAPRTLAYGGNLIYHVRGNDHALVPYVLGGGGGLTLLTRPELKPLGLPNSDTFFTGSVGGGMKWFVAPGWGVRGDYRFLMVKGKTTASEFFGLKENRYGHRVFGSLIYTFGK